jgi:isoamylase
VERAAPLSWCRPDGGEMSDQRGQRVTDDSLLLLFNGHQEPIDWVLPKQWDLWWDLVVDTGAPDREGESLSCDQPPPVAGRSVLVLQRRDTTPEAG